MSTTTTTPLDIASEVEPRFVFDDLSYAQYQAINDAIVDRHNPRMIYVQGRLTLLTTSRLHEWFAEVLGHLVVAVASGCGIDWEASGQATYRHPDLDAGIEGDRVYYLGPNARRMGGPVNIDLGNQPPPDLAIEVEHMHPADDALVAWGRIGVPEVWRYHVRTRTTSFWRRTAEGTDERTDRSLGLPLLRPEDVDERLRLAESLGSTSRWHALLGDWVRETLLPRRGAPG